MVLGPRSQVIIFHLHIGNSGGGEREQEVRQGCTPSNHVLSAILAPAGFHLLKVPLPSQTVPPTEDQAFKTLCLCWTYNTETWTGTTMFTVHFFLINCSLYSHTVSPFISSVWFTRCECRCLLLAFNFHLLGISIFIFHPQLVYLFSINFLHLAELGLVFQFI